MPISAAVLRDRELTPETHLPYRRHVTANVVGLAGRKFMTCLRFRGMPFETADVEELRGFRDQINMAWRNLATDALAVWVHTFRTMETEYPEGEFRTPFAQALDARYRSQLLGSRFYRNDHYLSLVWSAERGVGKAAGSFLERFKAARGQAGEIDSDVIAALEDKTRDLAAALDRYGPELLGLRSEDGVLFSEPSEFLHQILTGRQRRIPLVEGDISSAIVQDRPIFGRESMELREPGRSRFAAMFGVKEYPARPRPGMLDSLLTAPFEFVLSQSMAFMSKADARTVLSRKQNQMISANDDAVSQIDQLSTALDQLQSNEWTMGEHQLSLLVWADDPKSLMNNMGEGRRVLGDVPAVFAREELGLEPTFWSQFPGNFAYRIRSGAITSRNFASFAGFHTYPVGRSARNHWGPAVAMLKTRSGAPYFFNFHAADLGNTFICGPSGSGKTVLQNFLLAQLEKHRPTRVFFDKDNGGELFVRASGGTYLALKNGHPTGIAPLKAIEPTPRNLPFLSAFIRALVGRGDLLSARDEEKIANGLGSMLRLKPEDRSLWALREMLGQQDPEGIGARLERWCHGKPLGWVFDNEADELTLDADFIGFDMTDFLDNPEIRSPLMMYLFQRVERLIDGRRIVIDIDEFWKALADPAFEDLAQNKLKTIRKQNGFMVFGTQSPRDALLSPIAHTIIEQCATLIFTPNPKADAADYCDGFKLTRREFELIRHELTPESRRFIVKQGHVSVVAELDLGGMSDELAILSGTTANVELAREIIGRAGDDPAVWLPRFHQQRRAS